MSLGFEQIVKTEKNLLTDRGIMFGVAGAIAGAYVGQRIRMGFPGTAVAIAGGHFVGHSLHALTK